MQTLLEGESYPETRLKILGPERFMIKGARLLHMTQSSLYKGILRERKNPDARRGTQINLAVTQSSVGELNGDQPTDAELWQSLRNKTIGKRERGFMSRTMHNAYKTGRYWDNITN